MKKYILIALLLVVTSTAFSQKKAHLGFKAGMNYSTLTNSRVDFDYKPGVYVGMFLGIQVADFYTLQPELYYSNQGTKLGSRSEDFDFNGNIHYVTIGIANKFFVMKDQHFHIIVGAGFDLDWDDNFFNLINNGFESNNIFFLDMNLFGGLGYQFDSGLAIEARYKQGLIGVFTDEFFDSNSHFNAVFQVGMSYKFDFNK